MNNTSEATSTVPLHGPWSQIPEDSGLTAVDLFCGIGGFHIAAAQNGITTTFASEINRAASNCYETNLKLRPHGDLKLCKGNIPAHDILMAGFPCQPFSIIGPGSGLEDERGNLAFDVAEVTSCLRPSAVVMENVKQFSLHDQKRTIKRVEQAFQELGYDVSHRILNALDFGLPQKRERTFIVALEQGTRPIRWPVGLRKKRLPSLRTVLEKGRVPKKYHASPAIRRNRREKHQASRKPAIWHENKGGLISSHPYCCALRAGASHNYLLVNGWRRLTERELLRLQGFPEWFQPTGSYSQTKQQTGNAVAVPVARAVLAAILESLSSG